jgi:hypothetical protein
LKPVPFTTSDHGIHASTKLGDATADGRELLVDATYPSGRNGKGGVFVLFDKASGFFIWYYREIGKNEPQSPGMVETFTSDSIPYVADDRLVVFLKRDSDISVRESFERADSLDDSMSRALKSAADLLGEIERGSQGSYYKSFKDVPLTPLGRDFLGPKLSAAFGPIKLLSVSKLPSGWDILVQGQWKAKLTLNDKYETTGWEKIP